MHALFTAPISRRQLIRYKIFRSQLGALIGSAIVTFVFRSGNSSVGWTFFAGMLIVMATINLHLTGVSLRRDSLAAHGSSGLRRQWLPVAVMLSAVAIVALTVITEWGRLAGLSQPGQVLAEVERLGTTGLARVVLFPFAALIGLPLSATFGEFLARLPIALLILAANYFWVVRSDAAFEEASARFAEQQVSKSGAASARLAARVRRPPFTLGAYGRPEVAFLWKNLILAGRYASVRTLLSWLPVAIVGGLIVSRSTESTADMLAATCLAVAVIVVAVGPRIARNDLRSDLMHLTVLKAWPVRGAAVVRGEVLAPTVLLSALVWLCVVAAVFLSAGTSLAARLSIEHRASYALAALMLAPGVILAQIVAQNGLAVLFPGWVDLSPAATRGVDVMGQRMLVAGGLYLVVALALAPPAIAAVAVGWAMHALTGLVPIVLPSVAALGVLAVECAAAMEAIGALLDRTDVTAIPAET